MKVSETEAIVAWPSGKHSEWRISNDVRNDVCNLTDLAHSDYYGKFMEHHYYNTTIF